MANWSGTARTNYVRIADMDGLKKMLERIELKIDAGDDGKFMFESTDEYGGWPNHFSDEDDDNPDDFDFGIHIMPFVAEGEVLVTMECGAEKLRYLTGQAVAYQRRGQAVRIEMVAMNQIYAKAAEAFGVDVNIINACEY